MNFPLWGRDLPTRGCSLPLFATHFQHWMDLPQSSYLLRAVMMDSAPTTGLAKFCTSVRTV